MSVRHPQSECSNTPPSQPFAHEDSGSRSVSTQVSDTMSKVSTLSREERLHEQTSSNQSPGTGIVVAVHLASKHCDVRAATLIGTTWVVCNLSGAPLSLASFRSQSGGMRGQRRRFREEAKHCMIEMVWSIGNDDPSMLGLAPPTLHCGSCVRSVQFFFSVETHAWAAIVSPLHFCS